MKKQIFWTGLMLVLAIWVLCAPAFADRRSLVPKTCVDLTSFIQAILAMLVAVIARLVIPWIKNKSNKTKQEKLTTVIQTLAFTAEQLYGAGKGDDKLEWVMSQLKEQGHRVDPDAIEAALRELKPKDEQTCTRDEVPE